LLLADRLGVQWGDVVVLDGVNRKGKKKEFTTEEE
jgi:hypothetical protein